jgi:ribosomal protein S18 acetylase RimI-like enzyme
VRLARPAQAASEAAGISTGSNVEFAVKEDANAILNLLELSFDRYADQLPALYEIEAALSNRQVLAVKHDGQVAALVHFETQGFTSTVRFWVVAPQYRSHGYGSAVIREYFAMHGNVRRFILWVTAQNENAIQKYRHYGYAPDGLVDRVLVNSLVSK